MLEGGWRTTAKLPRRVVVELSPSEFEKLDRACGLEFRLLICFA